MVGLFAGGEFELELDSGVGRESDFLLEFANGGGEVILAGIEVTGRRGIPESGLAILFQRPFLEEDLSAVIEHQDVGGAMEQAQPMHVAPGTAVNDLVPFIYDIKKFVRV